MHGRPPSRNVRKIDNGLMNEDREGVNCKNSVLRAKVAEHSKKNLDAQLQHKHVVKKDYK